MTVRPNCTSVWVSDIKLGRSDDVTSDVCRGFLRKLEDCGRPLTGLFPQAVRVDWYGRRRTSSCVAVSRQ
jgi:hypothetical protein